MPFDIHPPPSQTLEHHASLLERQRRKELKLAYTPASRVYAAQRVEAERRTLMRDQTTLWARPTASTSQHMLSRWVAVRVRVGAHTSSPQKADVEPTVLCFSGVEGPGAAVNAC